MMPRMLAHIRPLGNGWFPAIFAALALALPASAATFADLNSVFGAEVWADENLWDDPDTAAAQRLNWPAESSTPRDSSFRLYAGPDVRVLGARPYSLALYGEAGAVAGLSMVFANKGDFELVASGDGFSPQKDKGGPRALREAKDQLAKQVAADEKTIEDKLTALLGPPKRTSFGGSKQTREQVKRWDWNGHAILLAAPDGEYAAVRVLPVDVADGSRKPRVTDDVLRAELATRIERRPNGDVVLKTIPMVDQGPKGFCVPATWERALRYMGIPADMYVLAMAGDTGLGGGTSIGAIVAGAKETVTRAGRRIETVPSNITLPVIKKYIDRGLPILWTMFSMEDVNKSVNQRMTARASATPEDWKAALAPIRKEAKKIKTDRTRGHVCMIIGYNEKTDEVAVSDSWGPEYEERWMTLEEVQGVTQGSSLAIYF